jgi:hypothetical protein
LLVGARVSNVPISGKALLPRQLRLPRMTHKSFNFPTIPRNCLTFISQAVHIGMVGSTFSQSCQICPAFCPHWPEEACRLTMAKIPTLLAFCHDLKARLPKSTDKPAIEALSSSLVGNIQRAKGVAEALFHKHVDIAKGTCTDMDIVATDVWNLATTLRRSANLTIPDRSHLLIRARVFCFFAIDIARRAYYAKAEDVPIEALLHILALSVKAAKTCIDGGQIESSLTCLQRSAELLAQLHDRMPSPDYTREMGRLEAEYFIFRTVVVGL